MDWPNTHLRFPQRDKGLFYYEQRRSFIVRKTLTDGVVKKWEVTTDKDWDESLHEAFRDDGRQTPGITAVLAARASDDADSQAQGDNPMLLEHLPFSRAVFDGITDNFFVHPSITQAIQRLGPSFSRTHLKLGDPLGPAIAYVCRGSNAWPGDIALSATHFPSTGLTYAVFFGCEFDEKPARVTALKSGDRITGLLSNSESTVAHPMLLVGIFAEIELRRHMPIVKKAVAGLLGTVDDVTAGEAGQEESHAIKPWVNMQFIKIKLEAWRRELEKMVAHVEELSRTLYQASEVVPREGDIDPLTLQPYTAAQITAFKIEEERRASLRATGERIKERLQDITNQYHEMISMSRMTMEGLTMATQLANTRTNTEIAEKTKKDGEQMKSIAILTMVFLPATFLATFFSMSFFKWDVPEGDVISRNIWVYFLITTCLTLGLYVWWSKTQSRRAANKGDVESGQGCKAL
ncbi:hypothetical protein MAPG_04131 [Magnaporthiopsis poae ATCC 64411]|uniref:Uncharacterized protein n=1 Tax=Magnaporthiopsis poae (strain ATCC 64411 / 73-15) TaxID=644358 RepID=A0A0C4DVW8_MAGP6|nr:hypothetical protein MAPG_04131 [Magnaporthiopsis poae ATCC 64411]